MSGWHVFWILMAVTIGLCQSALAQEPLDPERIINFVVIGDPHTCTGNPRNLPQVVERINALTI